MRISERSAYALEDVLWSYLAADGRPLNEIERTDPHLIDALSELQAAIPAVRTLYRDPGRPYHGRLKFSIQRVSELRDEMTIAEASAILGCRKRTIYHWIVAEDGLPVRRDGNLITIEGQRMLDFLIRTGRFVEKAPIL